MRPRALQITILHGSLLEVEAELIVNPANSYGLMGGGVAGVIRRIAGSSVEEEARRYAPIPVGKAVLTSGGRTKLKGIIHAPTMAEPAMRIPATNVDLATRAALDLADTHGFVSIALPGMGTGVGCVASQESARTMIHVIRQFDPTALQSIILVDVDPSMVQAWRDHL